MVSFIDFSFFFCAGLTFLSKRHEMFMTLLYQDPEFMAELQNGNCSFHWEITRRVIRRFCNTADQTMDFEALCAENPGKLVSVVLEMLKEIKSKGLENFLKTEGAVTVEQTFREHISEANRPAFDQYTEVLNQKEPVLRAIDEVEKNPEDTEIVNSNHPVVNELVHTTECTEIVNSPVLPVVNPLDSGSQGVVTPEVLPLSEAVSENTLPQELILLGVVVVGVVYGAYYAWTWFNKPKAEEIFPEKPEGLDEQEPPVPPVVTSSAFPVAPLVASLTLAATELVPPLVAPVTSAASEAFPVVLVAFGLIYYVYKKREQN